MPDASEILKARRPFRPQVWRELLGELLQDPEKAEQITLMMMSLRGMMMGGWPWWKIAAHCVNDCITACPTYVRPQVLWEKVEEERRRQ